MSYPYNADTALDPRTWLPGGEAVPASGQSIAAYPGPRVLVSGAGSEGVDGLYVSPGDLVNGREHYYLNGEITLSSVHLYWTGTVWAIELPFSSPLYTAPDADTPWEAVWEVGTGSPDAPTVTEFNP